MVYGLGFYCLFFIFTYIVKACVKNIKLYIIYLYSLVGKKAHFIFQIKNNKKENVKLN